jgi:ABC-type thiamin/hydroxymethylpyrimidine transport system permease subunit
MTALLALVGLVAALTAKVAALAAVVVAYAAGLFGSPVVLDTVSWGLILGVLTPLVTAVAQRPRWSTRTRTLVGVGVSIVVGVLTCLANGDIRSGQTVLSTIAVVLVAAQATYLGMWKPSLIAPKLESATSPSPSGGGDARHVA